MLMYVLLLAYSTLLIVNSIQFNSIQFRDERERLLLLPGYIVVVGLAKLRAIPKRCGECPCGTEFLW
jgi:hypothetical protein